MSEDEYGKRPGSLPEGMHRPRRRLARWVRTLVATGCLLGGLVLAVRGVTTSEGLWTWAGAAMIVVGAAGVFLARWMHRRNV
ncbi:hypothetical protein [Microbacterium sp. SLBN-146]|uniref:hypothetical protein n=1 Tax=Microbacterium sp. SLBN-146 TaxID=2768457 RepID=UPI001153A404|nr:hypothetical protein [Microbacterium sp. SLBN-146]TQJ31835.1 hypothetical protein FBY39_2320 [Microbacterium sp. SLBN-146]